MTLQNRAKCGYHLGTITPECFIDHPEMVDISFTDVDDAVKQIKKEVCLAFHLPKDDVLGFCSNHYDDSVSQCSNCNNVDMRFGVKKN